jgi:alpha-1,2-mannosyltransferase
VGAVSTRGGTRTARQQRRGTSLLAAGITAVAVALAAYLAYAATHPPHWTLYPVDLGVYQSGGLIVRHVAPLYNPHLATPLYSWPGYDGLHLKFTYPPFAAVLFAAVSFVPWRVLPDVSVAVNIALLAVACWVTVRALGSRDRRVLAGAALLLAAAGLWTEPVIRTLYLGQVNLALMALILWDLTQPDTRASRWWKGAGVGVAAGIKLVPLIFIPYLLLTRRFRQAAVAAAAFAATVAAGWAVLPADSARWWLGGLFINGGRTGFVGWEGNQSLLGFITRLSGSVAGAQPVWLAAAALTGAVGLAAAALLARAGHELPALLTAGLTGDLVSPVSWDHHWVWIVPGLAVAAHCGLRAWRAGRRRLAGGCWALTAAMFAVFAAWPDPLLGLRSTIAPFAFGLLWGPPNTDPSLYYTRGDQPWFHEYHWHGWQLLAGNAFLLGGLVLLAVLAVAAARTLAAGPAGPGGSPAGRAMPRGRAPSAVPGE